MNSRESKNHGYPPFLRGIGIEIPSLSIPPYSDDTKIFPCMDASEIFHAENSMEISQFNGDSMLSERQES